LNLDYGSQGFHVDCVFLDKHKNHILTFFGDDVFNATLSGKNMVPINLVATVGTDIVHLTLNDLDKSTLSTLVIGDG
jgi:hypothetical protein